MGSTRSLTFRLPAEWFPALVRAARAEDRSWSGQITRYVRLGLEADGHLERWERPELEACARE